VRKIGVLALQGAFVAHSKVLRALGAEPVEVRRPEHMDSVDALVLPGGESTTVSMLLETCGLFDPIADRLSGGMPTLGTCAGMILLATDVLDGRRDQRRFGAVDIAVRRNAFGRQIDSFESDLDVASLGDEALHAVFIRAPFVERVGPDVDVLATVDGHPVMCRQGAVIATAFHPELTDDPRVHELFLKEM
jgi:5'-phosphate synthase pdxT subunit